MHLPADTYKLKLRWGILSGLYCMTAGVVLTLFVFRPGINWYYRATFIDMVQGNAHRPYVYRALVPTMIRSIDAITPLWLKEAARSAGEGTRVIQMLGWEPQFLFTYAVAVTLLLCFLVGTAFVLRALVLHFYQYPPFVADLMPVIGLILLPALFRYYSHLYDPATLFLFSLALWYLAKEDIAWFYIIFILATLNKETSILLIGVFAVKEHAAMSRGRFIGHCVVLAALWIGIKGLIDYVFRNNPGSLVEFHLDHTLTIARDVPSMAYLVGVFVIGGILIQYRWNEKPLFLRRGLLITLLPLVVLAAFLGSIDETRGYYEAFPFALLLAVPTLVDVFDRGK